MANKNEFKKLLESMLENLTEPNNEIKKDIAAVLKEGIGSLTDVTSFLRKNIGSVKTRSILFWILGRVSDEETLSCLLDAFDIEENDEVIWEIAKSLVLCQRSE